jgi:predicted nucleic acid-binding protein
MKVIVNTGPLVFLSKINRLPILQKFGNIAIPKGVIAEINIKQDIVATSVTKALSDWLKVKTAKDKALLDVLIKELDGGEAEVICLALEQKADWVILDDQDARRFAHRYGLNVIGTLGLLAWAKKKGVIKSFRSEVEKLQKAGFYATHALIEKLAKVAGEN